MEIHISKIDAAKAQLETAIALFFEEKDPVSIHTLARASHEILETICKGKGINSVLKEGLEKFVKPEKQKVVLEKVNEAKNFFKHANKDPGNILKFNPDVSEYYLFDASRLYNLLKGGYTKAIFIYQVWFALKHPDIFPNHENNFRAMVSTLGPLYNPGNKLENYTLMSQAYDLSKSKGEIS